MENPYTAIFCLQVKINDFPVRETSYTATNLTQNKSYEFRVCAVNKAGSSSPSEPSTAVTPKDPDGESIYLLFCLTLSHLSATYLVDDLTGLYYVYLFYSDLSYIQLLEFFSMTLLMSIFFS